MARPILFSGPMVRALLDGRKTQTRRIVKPLSKRHPIVNLAEHGADIGLRTYSGRFNDPDSWGFIAAEDGADMVLADWPELCPYGKPGDLLWVRETWADLRGAGFGAPFGYAASTDSRGNEVRIEYGIKWKPSIHMPRVASRLTLRITDVRVQRLQDISEEDAIAEGLERSGALDGQELYRIPRGPLPAGVRVEPFKPEGQPPIPMYLLLWDQINGDGAAAGNPWVWALTFDVLRENVDKVKP